MVLAIVADIVGRLVFNSPIGGTTELVTVSVVAVLYMQIAHTPRSGNMTRSDAVLGRPIARRPRIGHGLEIDLVRFGIVTVIATEIGLLAPPHGLPVLVVHSTLERADISLEDIFVGAAPFALAMLFAPGLVTAIPAIWTCLVHLEL